MNKSYSNELRIHPYDINGYNGIKITALPVYMPPLDSSLGLWKSNFFFDMLVHVIKKMGCLNICKAIKIDPYFFFSFSISLVFS